MTEGICTHTTSSRLTGGHSKVLQCPRALVLPTRQGNTPGAADVAPSH